MDIMRMSHTRVTPLTLQIFQQKRKNGINTRANPVSMRVPDVCIFANAIFGQQKPIPTIAKWSET